MSADKLRTFLIERGEEVLREAVSVAKGHALAEGESAARLEKECRQVLSRLVPDEKKAEAEGRARLTLAAYLRASLAVREGIDRLLAAGNGAAGAEDISGEASLLLMRRVLRAVEMEGERRDAESGQMRELEGKTGRLQRTIDYLNKLFENSPDGIVTLDESGIVMTLNKAAKSITGYRANELLGVQFASLLADSKGARNLFKRMKKKWVSNYETLLRDKEGREVPISVSASVLETEEEGGTQMMLMLRDLSEVQEMKAQLIESEKLAAMAKIAGLVAHEIRNPLNSLFLNTDLLEDEIRKLGPITDRAQHLLSVVREEIDRLNSIIVNYLSLSKVSSLKPEPTDLNRFLADAAREKAPEMEEARVTLDESYAADLPDLFIDQNQMRRVVFNLVQNSINAMPDGGKLGLLTRAHGDESVSFVVKDSGVGIAPEHMGNVFNPFFSRLGGGTGLGLYLSREIVVSHQGKMTLQSEPGVGTTVEVTLPVLDEWEER